jgi:hypothetical protein
VDHVVRAHTHARTHANTNRSPQINLLPVIAPTTIVSPQGHLTISWNDTYYQLPPKLYPGEVPPLTPQQEEAIQVWRDTASRWAPGNCNYLPPFLPARRPVYLTPSIYWTMRVLGQRPHVVCGGRGHVKAGLA